MPERSYRLLLWTLAVTGLLLDQGSKYAVFSWLEHVPNHTHVLFGNPDRPGKEGGFHLVAVRDLVNGQWVPHVNTGAVWGFDFFGLLRSPQAVNTLFAVISLLAAAAIVYWSFLKSTARDRWLCAALGLILAGTLGNFYDRIVFHGVRDFLHWNYLFDWAVFNVADCCLVCGAGLLLIQAFLVPNPPSRSSDAQPNAAVLPKTTTEIAGAPRA
jgi:signal peptidase II